MSEGWARPWTAAPRALPDGPAGVPAPAAVGLLIPWYIYPEEIRTNPIYGALIELAQAHHAVPVMVILNADSGPGLVVDGNYTVAIQRLQAAGIRVLGYVRTNYTAQTIAQVEADLDLWRTLYPAIDGIFFDETTNDDDPAHVAYYVGLRKLARGKGYAPIVNNPGSGVPEAYFLAPTADVTIIWETAAWPSAADLKGDVAGGYIEHPYSQRGALVINAAFDAASFAAMRKYTQWVYVASDEDDPWGVPSAFLEQLFRALDLASPPPPVDLTPGPSVTIDAALGSTFRLTAAQNFTLENPTNPSPGQRVLVRITQDATGARLITFGTKFRFGADIPAAVLSTAPGLTDYLGCVYDAAADRWDVLAFVTGY